MAEAIIIDWYGPYNSKDDLRHEAKDFNDGTAILYMALKNRNIVNYIGMTTKPHSRFDNHEKLANAAHKHFYIGEITTRGAGGRRSTKHRSDHRMAEQALIAYLQPALNSNLREKDLEDCCVVYSRFFSVLNGEEPINVLPKFPRVIAYNSWSEEWDS
jgi:hypothetical protein